MQEIIWDFFHLALYRNLIYIISHMITFVIMYGINDYMVM
jgi:hypothetical protein